MNFSAASYDNLLPHLGMARIGLWFCPVCYPETLASSIATSPHYPWAVILSCSGCRSQWVVCKECSKNKKRFRSPMDILQHHRSKHRDPPLFLSSGEAVVTFHYFTILLILQVMAPIALQSECLPLLLLPTWHLL